MASGKLFGFLIACGLGATLIPGCSKQGEGERCDKIAARNEDCDSGLVCVDKSDLADESTDRCCPPEGDAISDSRCTPGGTLNTGGSAGTSGAAGAPASEGGAPASEGGAPATSQTSGAGGA